MTQPDMLLAWETRRSPLIGGSVTLALDGHIAEYGVGIKGEGLMEVWGAGLNNPNLKSLHFIIVV